MRHKTMVMLLVGLVIPAVCSAQAPKVGKWTGSVTPPDGEETAVTYDVTVSGDTLGIVIHAGEHGDFTATDVQYTDKTITFVFQPGPSVHCTLALNDERSYAGNCLGEDGSNATIVMVPPKE